MKRFTSVFTALLLFAASALPQNFPGVAGNPSVLSRPAGYFYAPAFVSQTMRVLVGNAAPARQPSPLSAQRAAAADCTSGRHNAAAPDDLQHPHADHRRLRARRC